MQVSKLAQATTRHISPVRQIMSFADPSFLEKNGVDPKTLISFAGGWVNHLAPEKLREGYIELCSDSDKFHTAGAYSPTLGTPRAKDAIIEFEASLHHMHGLKREEIAVGASSSQLAIDLFRTILDPEDIILFSDPTYCNYPTQLDVFFPHVKQVTFPFIDQSTFRYDIEERKEEWIDFIRETKPKATLLVVPDNPASQIVNDDFINSTIEVMKEVEGYLIVDFSYKEIIFGEAPKYFSLLPNDNLISLHSNSKWCRGLGRRMGWIEAPTEVVSGIEAFMNSSILCPDNFHQTAFSNYVLNHKSDLIDYVKKSSETYKKAADVLCHSIQKHIDRPFIIPEGGLYGVVNIGINSAQFAEDLLKETGVLVVPGWGFGRSLAKSVRLSYGPLVNNLSKIEEGISRIGNFLK